MIAEGAIYISIMTKEKHRDKQLSSQPVETSIWKNFVINISAVILVFILCIFLGVQLNNERLINNELYTRAISDFENIVLTRKWNAQYNGVYVEKLPGVESNPYLEDADITATDGKVYTKKNPALMTKEMSDLISPESGHSFRITSLKPLNPDNKADAFEAEALHAFEAGESEMFQIETSGEKSFYRYMAPLYVESSCMACHAHQGYRIGEVRGGISVRFDISDVKERLKWNRYAIWGLSLVVSILLITIITSFVRKVKRLLDEANAKIRKLAVTDELTRLYNRRYFLRRFEDEFGRAKRYGHPLACIMADVDFFKRVNDGHGHPAGDHVLKTIAGLMKEQERNSDVLARYGGEEFIVMLPETGLEGATLVAERLRSTVEAASITLDDGSKLHMTISAGVCSYSGDELAGVEDFNELIRVADEALYRAKGNGRNRVEVAEVT